ncbi:HMA2 domain-containing protein [Candidatus Albibeggiatoa sp. nov. NOAA]|uniref:HMA2 domain-containing protein n=1 Tax=Candidatus Albibeggiatoa sp. nov. NOAA TaxID=3162724 RepID=UPI003301E819|nr:heavy-metal-associated domain-containing protein [Thiotrichaceae bacterium]
MTAYFNIVHHIAGRIRFRISPSFLKQPIAKDSKKLTQQIRSINGIQDIRINLLVGSVVVQYDPNIIKPSMWEQWLQEYDEETEFNQLIERWQAQIG